MCDARVVIFPPDVLIILFGMAKIPSHFHMAARLVPRAADLTISFPFNYLDGSVRLFQFAASLGLV